MEGEQKRRREIERKERVETTGFKVKQHSGARETTAKASSLAKETRESSTVNASRVCSNRGS